MRVVLSMLGFLLLGSAVQAAEWRFEGGSVPIAYVDNGAAQLQFACRGGDLTVGFWVRAPKAEVTGAGSMNLSITPDGGGTAFAQDMPLIHVEGTSMVVRGPVARHWAGIAQRAKTTIRVAFVGDGGRQSLEANDFGAGGSSAAIGRVLETCR